MATQHPDNACAPWWQADPFVSTKAEIDELLLLFHEHAIDEYMWDWEGKYVDEAVGEKIYSQASEYFSQHPLGEDVHLTYRIPAFDEEKNHRMARAFMNVLSLADLARDLGLHRPPVTEMFLPLTTAASQPIKVREQFKKVAEYHNAVFHTDTNRHEMILKLFSVTPLVEDIKSMFSIEKILKPYWESLLAEGKDLTERGQRIFLARSDPALNSGLVPAVLAIKSALSTVYALAEELGFFVYPLLGTGSLPFRGSVNPLYTESFLEQYAGTRTYSIQSAFRYDYDREQMEAALKRIRSEAPKYAVVSVPEADRQRLAEVAADFSSIWSASIESLAETINAVSAFVPSRRERLQHIGLFGYSRGVGKVKLPRAIKFTAALYSLGIPPEVIATGRGLKRARETGNMDLIEKYYPALRADLQHAGKYLNRENIHLLAKETSVYKDIEEDIGAIEEVLGISLVQEKPRHIVHRNLTSTILQRLRSDELGKAEEIEADIVHAGVLRRSLG